MCTQCLENCEDLMNNSYYYCYTTITIRFTLKMIIIRVWLLKSEERNSPPEASGGDGNKGNPP